MEADGSGWKSPEEGKKKPLEDWDTNQSHYGKYPESVEAFLNFIHFKCVD